jgi:hypothetical protein
MSAHYLPTLGQGQKSNTRRAYGENVYDVVAHDVEGFCVTLGPNASGRLSAK